MKDSSFRSAIEDIKARLSIVDVVERYVSLKRTGRDYKGLCPFHDDKNPSMHVNEERGFFHCFSCGAGGDVFGFVMKYNSIGFMDAARELAQRAGVELPSSSRRAENRGEDSARKKRFFEINSLVCSLYRERLRSGKGSESARKYVESRGIDARTVEEFGLGFAPDGWDTVVRFAREKKIGISELEKLGLVAARKDSKGHYDWFRNRIIFPIYGMDGQVLGFGGRALDEDGGKNPKYMNSSESPVFSKKNVFYGLYNSRSEIRKKRQAVLVEGYMDFIKLYSSGVRNVVATLGTAFTRDHATVLRRFCEEVVIVYDGDAAGISSAVRAGEILLEREVSSKICRIPDGLDPDDYVERHGAGGFLELLGAAAGVCDFIIDDAFSKYREKKMSSGESVRVLAELVSKTRDPIEKSRALSRITGVFGIRESEILSLARSSGAGKNRGSLAPSPKVSGGDAVERMILKILLRFPDLVDVAETEKIVDYFENGNLKVILTRIGEVGFNDASSLISSFEDVDTQELLSELIFSSDDLADEKTSEKILGDCVTRLELRGMNFKLGDLRDRIQKQRNSSDKEQEKKLVRKYRDLEREYRDLEKSMRGNIS